MITVSHHYKYCKVTITTTTVGNTKDSSSNNGKLIYLHIVIMATFIDIITVVVAVVAVVAVLILIGILVASLVTAKCKKNKTSIID